jgi:hypothetical protein
MTSNFPSGPDTIPNNVNNSTPEFDTHPGVHNQLADAVMAVETSLLSGGSLSLSDHVAAADPHPVYLTQAEGDARYTLLGGGLTLPLTQHLTFSPDNTYDIGASGANRPRTLYIGTTIETPILTARPTALPAGSFIGLGSPSSRPGFMVAYGDGSGGVFQRWDVVGRPTGEFEVINNTQAGVTQLSIPQLSSYVAVRGLGFNVPADTFLQRDVANTLAQRNGTSAQTFRLYNTYTDASNYERFVAIWSGNNVYLATESSGTGVARFMDVGPSGNQALGFRTNALGRWQIDSTGHFFSRADNTLDIGASGASRPRNGYFGSGIYTGNTTATQGGALFGGSGVPAVGLGANGDVYFRTDGAAGATIYQKRAGAWAATAA